MKECKPTGVIMLICLVLITALLSGCQSDGQAETKAIAKVPEKVVQVSVLTVEQQDLIEKFTLPGTLDAWEDIVLSAELAGPIRWIGATEGQSLQRGQDILKIDTDTQLANLERDQTAYRVKKRKLDRYQKLVAEQLVSEQELDDLESQVESARADLRQAQLKLEKSTLYTPVSGVLDDLLVDRGEYVSVGQDLARVVQVDKLKVMVDVPEKDIPYLKVGDVVDIIPAVIQSPETRQWQGKLLHLSFLADSATRTYQAKIELNNDRLELRPGMIVRAEFVRRVLPESIAIPLYALIDREGEKIVFVVEEGTSRLRKVRTGAVIGSLVIIQQGLTAGDKVVVKGQQLLLDGSLVAVEGI